MAQNHMGRPMADVLGKPRIEVSRTIVGEAVIGTGRFFFLPSDFKDEEDIDDELGHIHEPEMR